MKVPDVLVPYMGGKTFLPFTKEKPNNSLVGGCCSSSAASLRSCRFHTTASRR